MPFRPGIDEPPMRHYTASFWQPDRPRNHALLRDNQIGKPLSTYDSNIVAGLQVVLLIVAVVFAAAGFTPLSYPIIAIGILGAIGLEFLKPRAPMGRFTMAPADTSSRR